MGCRTAQPHRGRMRKQTEALLRTADNTCSLRTGVSAGKLASGQLSPAALEKSGHFYPGGGRAGWRCSSGQPRLSLPHLTRPGPSLYTVAALSPGRCSAPPCHTPLGMPETRMPDSEGPSRASRPLPRQGSLLSHYGEPVGD